MPTKGISILGKIGGYLFFVFAIFNIVNIFFLKFIPSALITSIWVWNLLFAFLYMGFMLWQLLPRTLAQGAGQGRMKRIFLSLAFIFTFFTFAYFAIQQSIPGLYTYAMGQKGTQLATVELADSGSRGCWSSIKIQEGGMAGDAVCGVDDKFRAQLKPGDPICLHGTKSRFGIIVYSVSIPNGARC